jgi:hypothetical protein
MTKASSMIDPNITVMYAFRFESSDKLLQLTQQQLDCIPYLAALVTHKNDFLLAQNKNGEWVLRDPIQYISFMVILHSVTSENPYILFNELPEDSNILDTLQLFDYLNINAFPLPLLKNKELVRSNPTNIVNQEKRINYHKAKLTEVRQTAAEFIIALSKNEYDLHDSYTLERIFSLTRIILSNATVFSSRFRHHTLTVVKECCYLFFSVKQQNVMPTTRQIAEYSKTESFMYLYDDEQPVPDDFRNTFSWKGVYLPSEENKTNSLSASSKDTVDWRGVHQSTEENPIDLLPVADFSETFPEQIGFNGFIRMWLSSHLIIIESNQNYLLSILGFIECISILRRWVSFSEYLHDEELPIYEIKRNRKNNEAQSARSGRFNTLPTRPKTDKFKHRSGPKAQKYR